MKKKAKSLSNIYLPVNTLKPQHRLGWIAGLPMGSQHSCGEMDSDGTGTPRFARNTAGRLVADVLHHSAGTSGCRQYHDVQTFQAIAMADRNTLGGMDLYFRFTKSNAGNLEGF